MAPLEESLQTDRLYEYTEAGLELSSYCVVMYCPPFLISERSAV